jgi:hypothetical protein
MRADLNRNYAVAQARAKSRGIDAQIRQLEQLLATSTATINIRPSLLYNIAAGQNYMTYYRTYETNLREIAERTYHEHRSAVDAKVHPGYGHEIINAALSPDGRGLMNYGNITIELKSISIEDRASVMRENAFNFYERYDLGKRDAIEGPGWRATWADRVLLGVAHLEPALTLAVADRDLSQQVLYNGATRHEDRYIEVHIYGELSWETFAQVTLEKPLTVPKERGDWDFLRQRFTARGIIVKG